MLGLLTLVRPWWSGRAITTPSTHSLAGGVLALTPDGDRLLAVNPDSNSVSLIDTQTNTPLAEIAAGPDPRGVAVDPAGSFAYITCRGADEIAVLDLDTLEITARLPTGDRPVGVAVSPSGNLLAVAEYGADAVRLIDPQTGATRQVVPVLDRPHGLAFTPDGARLLVSHLLTGSVTVIALQPNHLHLPLLLQSTLGFSLHGFQIPARGPLPARVLTTWPNVGPAPAVVVNPAGTRAYLPQTMAHGQGLNTQFDNTVFPKVSVLNLETLAHQTSEHISLPEVDQPVGLPWDIALSPLSPELWVVNAASDDLSVIDISSPTAPHRTAHLPVGANPRGVIISPGGQTAYVNNILDGTVTVIDTQAYTVTTTITATEIPLAPLLLHGKRLFHTSSRPDIAQARWISCNTCHIEAEHDGRTWLLQYLGEVPPGETPLITRNTTSLLGMIETYPLRWSAEWDESADSEFSVRFEQFGSGLIHSGDMNPTLGLPNQGRSYDLDALAAYIDSLAVPPRTEPLSPAALRGQAIFESPETGCAACHPAPLYTDLQVHDVGTADNDGEWFGPFIDTPTLRYLYDSAPYLHDGSAATLYEALTAGNPNDEHGVTSQLSEAEIQDLIAFLLTLPYH